jgi:hypothetical protein
MSLHGILDIREVASEIREVANQRGLMRCVCY